MAMSHRRVWAWVRRTSADQRGIGLLELAMTLVVIGILLAIAAPSIQNYIAQQELRSNAREVVEVLREARGAAIDEGLPRRVAFDKDSGTYQVYRYTSTGWQPDQEEQRLGASVSFARIQFPAVNQGSVPVPKDSAYFDTRGHYPSPLRGEYEVVLQGRLGTEATIVVYAETGGVTGP